MSIHLDPSKRHDFVFFFEAKGSNPNGDPDAGNMPRTDPETMQGLVTDGSVKRKIRDLVGMVKGYESPYDIFIRMDRSLNEKIEASEEAIEELEDEPTDTREKRRYRQEWMCRHYFDVRTFGAVMSTGDENIAGRVTGPMQLTISRTVDPVTITDMTITRQGVTDEEEFEGKDTEMGRKPVVLYGLYRGHGYYNPKLAEKTGFGSEDLELFWEALQQGFEQDRSALRSQVNMRRIYVFSHEDPLGNAPAYRLFEKIQARRQTDTPRSFRDGYEIAVPGEEDLPDGVHLASVIN